MIQPSSKSSQPEINLQESLLQEKFETNKNIFNSDVQLNKLQIQNSVYTECIIPQQQQCKWILKICQYFNNQNTQDSDDQTTQLGNLQQSIKTDLKLYFIFALIFRNSFFVKDQLAKTGVSLISSGYTYILIILEIFKGYLVHKFHGATRNVQGCLSNEQTVRLFIFVICQRLILILISFNVWKNNSMITLIIFQGLRTFFLSYLIFIIKVSIPLQFIVFTFSQLIYDYEITFKYLDESDRLSYRLFITNFFVNILTWICILNNTQFLEINFKFQNKSQQQEIEKYEIKQPAEKINEQPTHKENDFQNIIMNQICNLQTESQVLDPCLIQQSKISFIQEQIEDIQILKQDIKLNNESKLENKISPFMDQPYFRQQQILDLKLSLNSAIQEESDSDCSSESAKQIIKSNTSRSSNEIDQINDQIQSIKDQVESSFQNSTNQISDIKIKKVNILKNQILQQRKLRKSNSVESQDSLIENKLVQMQNLFDDRENDYFFNCLSPCSIVFQPMHQQQSNDLKNKIFEQVIKSQQQQIQIKKSESIRLIKNVKILKISKEFFDKLPKKMKNNQDSENNFKAATRNRTILFSNLFQSHQQKIQQSVFKHSGKKNNYFVSQDYQPLCFNELKNEYQEILQERIYKPHLISNSTILQFQQQEKREMKYSVIDIIDMYISEHKTNKEFYFKVCLLDLKNQQKKVNNLKIEKFQQEDQNQINDQSDQEKPMQSTYDNSKIQLNYDTLFFYYKFDLKLIDHILDKNQVDRDAEKKILLTITDISAPLKSQQKICDQMYLDAIECNYSHEQMTPLNSILANSKIVYKRFLDLIQFQENSYNQIKDSQTIDQAKKDNQQTLKLLKAIQQYGEIMWFYNQNQIQRIKIQKNEFKKNYRTSNLIEEIIEKVVNPFEPQINSRKIKILLCLDRIFEIGKVKFDLQMYQLILFNIIQNAVKYNEFEGNILIRTKLRPISQEQETEQSTPQIFQSQIKRLTGWNFDDLDYIETHVLETEIFDTGIGINQDRQKMLFVPFLELKTKQNLQEVKDNNIGMGLACSHQIVKQFGGDIKLKRSRKGLTVFAFKIPVYIENIDQVNKTKNKEEFDLDCYIQKKKGPKLLEVNQQTLKKQLQEYINATKLQNIKELVLEEIKLIQNSKSQNQVQNYILNASKKSTRKNFNQQSIYQNINILNQQIIEDNQNYSQQAISPKKNRSNSVCQQFFPFSHSVHRCIVKPDQEIFQFQLQNKPSLKKLKKKKKVQKKSSDQNIAVRSSPQIQQDQSDSISDHSDNSFNEDDLNFEKYESNKKQNEQENNCKANLQKQKDNENNQQQVRVISLVHDDNKNLTNRVQSKESFKKSFDYLSQKPAQKFTSSQTVLLNKKSPSQQNNKLEFKKLKKFQSFKIKNKNNENDEKQFLQKQQIFFRPCNQLLNSSSKKLFNYDLNKLDRENKLLIARVVLQGNHHDEIVNLFFQKAKQLTEPQKYEKIREIEKIHSQRNQITLRNQQEFYVDLQIEKDPVFKMPILNKTTNRFVNNSIQAYPSSQNQEIKGLFSINQQPINQKKINNNQKSKSQLNFENNISKNFQKDQTNKQKFKIREQQDRKYKKKSKKLSDENSSFSSVYDIVLDELPNIKKKESKDLIYDLQEQLKQSRQKHLGDQGMLWMKEMLQQKGISSFIENQEIKNDNLSLNSSYSNSDQKSIMSYDNPHSFNSDESFKKKKAKVNLSKKEVLFNIKDYQILDGCLQFIDSNDNNNEFELKSLSDNQQEILSIQNNDVYQIQEEENKEIDLQKKSKKKKQKKKKIYKNFGGLRSIFEEQEESIESLDLGKKVSTKKLNKFKNQSGLLMYDKIKKSRNSDSLSNQENSQSEMQRLSLDINYKKLLFIQQEKSQKIIKIVEDIKDRVPAYKDPYNNSFSDSQLSSQSIVNQKCLKDSEIYDGNPPIEEGDEEDPEDEQSEDKEDEQSEFSDCGCQLKVMIVDDIQFNILPIKFMLQDFTKNIQEAANGQIAVDLFKQGLDKPCGCKNRAYKLIFMDLQMPVKDGYQASVDIFQLQKETNRLQSILKIESGSGNEDQGIVDCRIVVLTSYTSDTILKKCLESGCSEILNKPLVHEKLHQVMWKHFFRVDRSQYEKIYNDQFDKQYQGQF